jgi:flagellar basal-body rod protein FlgB
MSKTHEKHFDLSIDINTAQKFRNPYQPDTGDGNTVDVQVERNKFMENSMEYQTSLSFLNSKIKGLNKALSSGSGG